MMARVTSWPHGHPMGPPPSAANTAAATVVLGATMLLTLLLLLLLPDPAAPLLQPRETPGPVAVSEEQQEEEEEEDEEEEEEEGEEGWASATRVRDFSCVLYDAAFLNCSWRPGPAAPHDVQYYLFTASSSDRNREHECPQYITTATGSWPGSPGGPHTGCHVRDLSAFGSVNYFRVNGSSRQGGHRGPIGVLYTRLSAKQIERFAAPGEVSAWCNATHCRATWSQPRTWVPLHFLDFHYQLRIRNAQDVKEEEEEEEEEEMKDLVDVASREELAFVFPSLAPRPRQEVRVRAGDVRGPLWSAWSVPALFGSDGSTTPGAAIYLVAVLGTLLGGLGLGFCYVRVMHSSAMFVPAIRDKLTDDAGIAVNAHGHDHTTLHVATATGTHGNNDDGEGEEEEEEDVLTVQEVTPARPCDPANVTAAATTAAGIQI